MHMKALLGLIALFTSPWFVAAQTFTNVSDLIDADPTVFAAGATIVDANSDGLMDLYRFQGLYLQRADGTFWDSRSEVGLTNPDGSSAEGVLVFGAIFGDYDNDGYQDIFFEDLNEFSHLFRGRGDGSFVQSNDEAGVSIPSVLQGSAWADFDRNGFIDLFAGGDGDASALFLNNGDATFQNASANVAYSPFKNVYGVAAADYDNDGDIDIYLSSCSSDPAMSTNMLFKNNGFGQFTNVAPALGIDDDRGGWAVLWEDVNNDGWLDLFVSNQRVSGSSIETRPGYNRMYISNGMGGFVDMADAMGIAGAENDATIGATAGDFNNDGFVDFATATLTGTNPGIKVYLNNGGTSFTDITTQEIEDSGMQAITSGDINGDGWIDLFVPGFQQERLFYNDGGTNHYLSIALVGKLSNRSGIGARIEVHAPGISQIREISAGSGMTSQPNGLTAHFGMAEHSSIDSVIIRWPSGTVDRLDNILADQKLTIVEGVGINHAPASFLALSPAADSILGAPLNVYFEWEHAGDVENAALEYTLKILDTATGELAHYETTDSSMVIDGVDFTSDVQYFWTVEASDGHSVRRSTERRGFMVAFPSNISHAQHPELETTVDVYPNPSRSISSIRVDMRRAARLTLEIIDITGRRVSYTDFGVVAAGIQETELTGAGADRAKLQAGVYLYRVVVGDEVISGKIVRQ